MILEVGTKEYLIALDEARNTTKFTLHLQKYVDDHSIFYDIWDVYHNHNISNEFGSAVSGFRKKVEILPDYPSEAMLVLIEDDAKKALEASAKYSKWLREGREKAIELKRKEEAKK
jgi:hypothetical protein